jgi:hypothetical protein
MTVVGTTYQTILNHLMLHSCQLCDVAHDFRNDPRTLKHTVFCLNKYEVIFVLETCETCTAGGTSIVGTSVQS